MLLNNICESFNKYIMELSSRQAYHYLVRDYSKAIDAAVQTKKDDLDKIIDNLCPKIQKKLEKVKLEAMDCHYIWKRG